MHFDTDFPCRFDYFPVMEGQSKVSISDSSAYFRGEADQLVL